MIFFLFKFSCFFRHSSPVQILPIIGLISEYMNSLMCKLRTFPFFSLCPLQLFCSQCARQLRFQHVKPVLFAEAKEHFSATVNNF